ncbi:MAG: ABC transporter permease [Caldiserica bacterium]|jgi:ABC-2 type transport system permease protein|nr:ABC transporter permease [Caldisericota bacterium]MDH7563216.1 ABC transporter permease [Caldisericota bacterium]
MKKSWQIALKDLKLRIRDPSSFIVLLIMPLLLIFILGSAFKSGFQVSPFKVPLALSDQDRGEISRILKEEVFQNPELSKMIVLKEVSDPTEAKKLISSGNVSCSIIIPEGTSKAIFEGKTSTIFIYGNPEESIKAGVVKNIVEEFALEVTGRSVILSTTAGELLSHSLISSSQVKDLINSWKENLPPSPELIHEEKETAEANRPSSAMDYYAVGMGAMYLLFAANYGAKSILEEKRRGTTLRLFASPVGSFAILFGKLLGIALFTLLQFLLIILFTTLFFGVNWGSSVLGIAFLTIASVFAMSGLGALLSSVLKTEAQVSAIGPAVSIILTFLGGGMVPIYGWPSWAEVLSRFTPNRWILEGFFSLMRGKGIAEIVLPLLVLGGTGAALFSLAVLIFRYRREF